MNLITRAEWKARPPVNRTSLVRTVQRGTAVHYSGANADEQASHANCASRVRAIQNYHMDVRKWADIAYSYLICKHGYVFAGRGIGVRTAAQGTNSGNDAFHAVCFLGDDTAARDDVTDAGRRALKDAVNTCNGWSRGREVRPHSYFHSTGCPGDQLRSWIDAGMPTVPGEEDDELALFTTQTQFEKAVEKAVDHIMSLGLTGNRDGAIRAWAAKVDKTDANVRKILQHLGIPAE